MHVYALICRPGGETYPMIRVGPDLLITLRLPLGELSSEHFEVVRVELDGGPAVSLRDALPVSSGAGSPDGSGALDFFLKVPLPGPYEPLHNDESLDWPPTRQVLEQLAAVAAQQVIDAGDVLNALSPMVPHPRPGWGCWLVPWCDPHDPCRPGGPGY